MNIKRRHFEMACLASAAVLLGACSSTPDVKTQDSIASEVVTSERVFDIAPASASVVQKTKAAPAQKAVVPTRSVTRVLQLLAEPAVQQLLEQV